jgi:TonB family protein
MAGGERTVPAGVPEVGSPGLSGAGERREKSATTDGSDEKEPRVSEDRDALLLPTRGKEPVRQESADPLEQGEKGEKGKGGQQAGGYVPELNQTRVEGSISNRGALGVDAVKTPMGVYRQQLTMQIGSRWEHHRRKLMDLISVGTVRVLFYVTREGRVQDLRVLESSSNQTFVEVCERSVREAEIAPPPPEVELMNDGRMEIAFTFTIF